MAIDKKRAATVFKAFCDENRIRILEQLCSGEKCACTLLDSLNITQPTLSHHMKILNEADIVISRKDGKWTHYSISQNGVEYALEFLNVLTNTNIMNNK